MTYKWFAQFPQFQHQPLMENITDGTPAYEQACRNMVKVGMTFVLEHCSKGDMRWHAALDDLGEYVVVCDTPLTHKLNAVMLCEAPEGLTNADHMETMRRVFYIGKRGFKAYKEKYEKAVPKHAVRN